MPSLTRPPCAAQPLTVRAVLRLHTSSVASKLAAARIFTYCVRGLGESPPFSFSVFIAFALPPVRKSMSSAGLLLKWPWRTLATTFMASLAPCASSAWKVSGVSTNLSDPGLDVLNTVAFPSHQSNLRRLLTATRLPSCSLRGSDARSERTLLRPVRRAAASQQVTCLTIRLTPSCLHRAGTCNCTRDGVQRQPESASIRNRAQMAALSDWIGSAKWNPSHGRKGSKSRAKTHLSGHRLAAPQMMRQWSHRLPPAHAREYSRQPCMNTKGGEEVPARIQCRLFNGSHAGLRSRPKPFDHSRPKPFDHS